MSGEYKNKGSISEVYDVTSLGGGLALVKKRKIDFTHAKATWLLELKEFVADRPLRQRHVDYLVRCMKRGTFLPELVRLMVCEFDGELYRMNGQHTAWARLEVPEEVSCEVQLLEYRAESEQDMRTLYASIDRGAPRTKANVITSYLAGSSDFSGIRHETLRLLPRGLAFWLWSTIRERAEHDGDDIAYLLSTDYHGLAMKLGRFIEQYPLRESKHIIRAPVVAAMFGSFHKAPQAAAEFWSPVMDGTGIGQKMDPRLKLRNALLQTSIGLGAGAGSSQKKVSQEYMFRLCVAAWNAFREERPLQVLRANEQGKRPKLK